MVEKHRKSFDEIRAAVHDGHELASDEDLVDFFNEGQEQPTVAASGDQIQAPAAEPAPTQPEPALPAGTDDEGQATTLASLPEKFRVGDDVDASLKKMADSYNELQAELARSRQDVSQLQSFVQELSNKPGQAPKVQQPEVSQQDVEIDDTTVFQQPVDSIRRIALAEIRKAIAPAFQEYDAYSRRREAVERFKTDHPDFDNFRSEMLEVLKKNPQWESDPTALPRVYETAKQIAAQKVQSISPQIPQADIAKQKEEWMKEAEERAVKNIMEAVRKRKSAAGMLPGSNATSVQQRVEQEPKTQQKTPEEQIFDDMLTSGPKRMDDLLNK